MVDNYYAVISSNKNLERVHIIIVTVILYYRLLDYRKKLRVMLENMWFMVKVDVRLKIIVMILLVRTMSRVIQ